MGHYTLAGITLPKSMVCSKTKGLIRSKQNKKIRKINLLVPYTSEAGETELKTELLYVWYSSMYLHSRCEVTLAKLNISMAVQ